MTPASVCFSVCALTHPLYWVLLNCFPTPVHFGLRALNGDDGQVFQSYELQLHATAFSCFHTFDDSLSAQSIFLMYLTYLSTMKCSFQNSFEISVVKGYVSSGFPIVKKSDSNVMCFNRIF